MADSDLLHAFRTIAQVPEKLKSQSETIQLLTAKLKELNTAHDALQERSAHLEAALKEHGALQAELDQLRKANKVAEAQKVALLDRQEALQVSCKVSCKAAESERDAALVELEHLRAELPQAHPVQQPLDRQPQDVQAEDDDVVVVAEDFAMNVPATDILPKHIPEKWSAGLRAASVEVGPEAMQTRFTRAFLSSQLGGGTQGVVMRVAKTNTAVVLKQFGVERYYCPNSRGNPWLPRTPGSHGYMFIGMGKVDQAAGQGECCEMFVGMGQNDWRYFGTYTCTRVATLAVDDFNALSEDDKRRYCTFTKDKKLALTENEARSKYLAGELHVPCVRLECAAFNHELFRALCANWASFVAPAMSTKRPRTSSTELLPSSKPSAPPATEPRASGRLREVPRVSYMDDDDLGGTSATSPRMKRRKLSECCVEVPLNPIPVSSICKNDELCNG